MPLRRQVSLPREHPGSFVTWAGGHWRPSRWCRHTLAPTRRAQCRIGGYCALHDASSRLSYQQLGSLAGPSELLCTGASRAADRNSSATGIHGALSPDRPADVAAGPEDERADKNFFIDILRHIPHPKAAGLLGNGASETDSLRRGGPAHQESTGARGASGPGTGAQGAGRSRGR